MLPITFRRTVPARAAASWNPFNGLERVSAEFDRLLDWSNGGFLAWPGEGLRPWINVYNGDDEAVVTAELPGYELKDIEVSVEGNKLSLQGSSGREEKRADQEAYVRRERRQGEFARSVSLPFGVDRDAVTAEFKDGILTVVLPRVAEDKPKKIDVKAK